MPEARGAIQPITADYLCEMCGEGLRSTGLILDSYLPKIRMLARTGIVTFFQV